MEQLAAAKKPIAIPTYNEVRGQAVTLALRVAIGAATINLLWNGYHYRGTQSSINGGYVVVLFVTEDAAQKGIVADNVAQTRNLSRDVQGNLEESTSVLKGLSEERKGLSSQVVDLGARVDALTKLQAKLEHGVHRLEEIGLELEGRVKMKPTWTAAQDGRFEFLGAHVQVIKLEDNTFRFTQC